MKKITCSNIPYIAYRTVKKSFSLTWKLFIFMAPFLVKISRTVCSLFIKSDFLVALFTGISIVSLLDFFFPMNKIVAFFIVVFFALSGLISVLISRNNNLKGGRYE